MIRPCVGVWKCSRHQFEANEEVDLYGCSVFSTDKACALGQCSPEKRQIVPDASRLDVSQHAS